MVSPLNSILVGARRRASAPSPRGAVACAAVLLVLTFVVRAAAAPAGERAMSDGDVRKAEKVLAKLRLLHEAADAGDAGAYRRLASKLYPDLFVKVAELRPGDVSTDLSTAVFLTEQLGRTWSAAGAAADCRGERPDIYLPLCLGLRGGSARQLLLAKSRRHASWAEALLKNGRGVDDADTARSLAEVRAARANDQLIAAHVVETLRLLEAPPGPSPAVADIRERFDASASGVGADEKFAEALRDAGALLAWLPRSPTFYHLLSARQAYADGLWWHGKARRAKSLVISAKNFVPDPLKDLGLNAEQVSATARFNWRSATRHTRLAELSLSRPAL